MNFELMFQLLYFGFVPGHKSGTCFVVCICRRAIGLHGHARCMLFIGGGPFIFLHLRTQERTSQSICTVRGLNLANSLLEKLMPCL